jgi:hypothetical protein
MSVVLFLHFLSILYGIQSISELSMDERIHYLAQFSLVYREFCKCSGIYLPFGIAKRIPMAALKRFLIRRLLISDKHFMYGKTRSRFEVRIIKSSFDFLRFLKFIHDPLRLSMVSFRDRSFQGPIACCWHAGLNCLLVTTFNSVIKVHIGTLRQQKPKFERLCKTPFDNNYGIDVSVDGLIVVSGYNSNRIILIESNGKLLGVYEIANAQVQQQLLPRNGPLHYSGVCFSHDGRYILCFSNKGIQVIDRSGNFICTFGSFGAKPELFRTEGQIVRLLEEDMFAISDVGNNRVQIVKIDWRQLTWKVLKIFGNNCFIDPLGIVAMGNCFVTFSFSEQMIYINNTSGEVIEVPTQLMPGTRFACSLPDGSIVIVNQSHSLVTLIQENPNIPITPFSGLGLEKLKF